MPSGCWRELGRRPFGLDWLTISVWMWLRVRELDTEWQPTIMPTHTRDSTIQLFHSFSGWFSSIPPLGDQSSASGCPYTVCVPILGHHPDFLVFYLPQKMGRQEDILFDAGRNVLLGVPLGNFLSPEPHYLHAGVTLSCQHMGLPHALSFMDNQRRTETPKTSSIPMFALDARRVHCCDNHWMTCPLQDICWSSLTRPDHIALELSVRCTVLSIDRLDETANLVLRSDALRDEQSKQCGDVELEFVVFLLEAIKVALGVVELTWCMASHHPAFQALDFPPLFLQIHLLT